MAVLSKLAVDIFSPVDNSGKARAISEQDAQVWGTEIERLIFLFISTGGLLYTSRNALYADLLHGANSSAWVYGDATAAYNGIYRKIGASGTGSWSRVGDLPYSVIYATDVGSGSGSAFIATASIPVSEAALVAVNVHDTNTGTPVTISFNGGTPLTIKTNSGGNPAVGGLVAGMQLLGRVSGSTFRLYSDQSSAAIQAAAEDAAELSQEWAEGTLPGGVGSKSAREWALVAQGAVTYNRTVARGTTTGAGPYDMGVQIGSANNIDVKIGGVIQDHNKYTISGTTFTMTANPGSGLPWEAVLQTEVRALGAPSDGTVSAAALANSAVTSAKLAAGAVTQTALAPALLNYLDTRLSEGVGNELPTICLTFDQYPDTTGDAYTIMSSYGLTGTYFVSPYQIDAPGGTTRADLAQMKATGWEIGAYSGTNFVTAEASNRLLMLDAMKALKDDMEALGLPVTSLAPNQRAWNSKLAGLVDGYFTHVRVVDFFRSTYGYYQPLPVSRKNKLWVKYGGSASLTTSDTAISLAAQVDDLIALGGLWTVITHRVANSGDVNYRVPNAVFDAFCSKIATERDAGRLRVIRFRDL